MNDRAMPTPPAGRIAHPMPGLVDARILLVDNDPGTIQWLSRVLSGYPELRFANSGAEALRQALTWRPEMILLDAEMPGMSGFDVFRALHADPQLADVPVIFVTQHGEAQVETAVFELGAADFITKPVAGPALRARVAMHLRLRRMAGALSALDQQDGLTGLANRPRLDDLLAVEWARAERSGQPLSLLLADIDHWRDYNDMRGAAVGDDGLRRIARLMQALPQRAGDLAARCGSDEFALLLPGTDAAGAAALAARLADSLFGLNLAHPASPVSNRVTLSIGVATWPARHASSARSAFLHGALRDAAASALGDARAAGGHRIVRRVLPGAMAEAIDTLTAAASPAAH